MLATGLVVDDAIVVIENIAAPPGRDARRPARRRRRRDGRGGGRGHRDLAGADRGVRAGRVLPGTTGLLYRQFSLTIAFSVAISAFNALTLSPALAALLAARRSEGEQRLRRCSAGSTAAFDGTRERYRRALGLAAAPSRLGRRRLRRRPGADRCLVFRARAHRLRPRRGPELLHRPVIGPQGASLDYMTGIAKQVEAQLTSRPRSSTSSRCSASASPATAPTAASSSPA